MKKVFRFLQAVSVLGLLAGCTGFHKDKLPAGDIDIYKLYAGEIDILHNTTLRTDSKEKYEAALTLYNNVDFSFVRDLPTLEKIFGARDARMSKPKFDEQTIIYLYRYKGKRIRFVFTRYKNAIVHSECTDKID